MTAELLLMPALPALVTDAVEAETGWTVHRADDQGGSPVDPARISALVIHGADVLTPRTIDLYPNLKLIAVHGVGYDRIDAAHAQSRGIVVTHTPDVLSAEVADTAIMLTLAALRRLTAAERYIRDGRWTASDRFPLTRRATGKRYGILGLGRIGKAIAERLVPFAGEIAYHNRRPVEGSPWRYEADLVELARWADVLIVATPGGAGTAGLVSAEVIEAVGPDGIIVNIARGTVIDEPALVAAVESGKLGGVGLDVFAQEPTVPEAFRIRDNCVIAPHIGSATIETRQDMAQLVVDNLKSVLLSGAAPLTPVPKA